ncbi:MAG: aldo/keto reductase [Halobacteriaceae archaeon]
MTDRAVGATAAATAAYADQFRDAFARTYFRPLDGLAASSVGIGTCVGPPTDTVDDRYREAIRLALEHGVNLLATAADARCGRAEGVVGDALASADVDREAVILVTRGGFVPFDGDRPADPGQFVRAQYVDTGVVDVDDLVMGAHCLSPSFLDHQIDRSRAALGVDTIDCYLLQAPEVQRDEHPEETVYDRLEDAFRTLERRVEDGAIRCYGVATRSAFRVGPGHDRYLSLRSVVARARAAATAAGADATHFRVVDLPFSATMAGAFTRPVHEGFDGETAALRFCRDAGLDVLASSPLAGGDLVGSLPAHVADRVEGETGAQRALNFARSAPGVVSAVAATSRSAHVRENIAAGTFEPLGARAFDQTFD